MKARAYLALMALAVLVPIVLFSTIGLDMLLRAERAAALRGLQESSRAVALAVDRELAVAESRARTLATSTSLINGNLPEFDQRTRLANEGGASWTVLFNRDGQQLVNTHVPLGTPLPKRDHPEIGVKLLQEQRMQATDLKRGPLANDYVVAIEVPVFIDGQPRYVIDQAFLAGEFDRVLADAKLPQGWIIGMFDRNGISIARVPGGRGMAGKPVRQELYDAARANGEGIVRHLTRDGVDVYDAYTHSALSGWTIAVGVPVRIIEAAARRAVKMAAIGLVAAVLCAVIVAVAFSRRLVRSIERAVSSAAMLGRREMPRHYSSGVLEFDRLHAALTEAGGLLHAETESRARAESERTLLLASERAARREAETQNRAKDQFLAMLGHELRNPLSAISSAIGLLDHPQASKEAGERARAVIRRQSMHLAHIVDDLLDLSRLMNGKVVLERKPLDLAEALNDYLQGLQATGRASGHQLQVRSMPAPILADPTRIEQILANLVGNALKYTPPGGCVDIAISVDGAHALLTVRDTGVGIAPDLLDRVFDVFVQGADSLDRSQGGLGIGLALVRQLVRLHGGEVSADSAGIGCGSVFVVRLPLARERQATFGPAQRAGGGASVLVVEDNPDGLDMLSAMLSAMEFRVYEAANGDEGVRLAREHQPDAALVDIGLPGLDGYGVARSLRADPRTRGMRLIALSGYCQPEDRQRALDAGFDEHLSKPVSGAVLAAALGAAQEVTTRRVQ
ncbi:hybrid sensor histidine kinase/response regulator [Noviherbaspirillum pedocola]|uniref:histidine kinase n=1 Tax=Noviherbaspirillum pedocola TaxID=2801341 RepID=A0A934SR92_9BURK|nr:ATP-binding protein [Noviherbaspirillum pedocola]MBK4734030.1 response regulator [Noviherbaspirillum pedocola]